MSKLVSVYCYLDPWNFLDLDDPSGLPKPKLSNLAPPASDRQVVPLDERLL